MSKVLSPGFWIGPLLFIILLVLDPFGGETHASAVCGVILWMLIWWITECVPMAVTSLLPIVLFPVLGVLSIEQTCKSYGNRFVFLFLGGFIIALALEKWHLHKRVALNIVNITGVGANRIILGFFGASFLISMWISNTATALMMFPIAASVVNLILSNNSKLDQKGARNFALVLMLCVAYGASIGGIATIVGSPPNAAMAAILSGKFDVTITFMKWFSYGFPFALMLFVLSYFLLVKVIYPNRLGKFEMGHELIHHELRLLGKWKMQEKIIFGIFVCTAVSWILLDYVSPALKAAGIQLTDASIAVIAGILLFIIPGNGIKSEPILEWRDTEKLPWGVLLMFGGGLALAEGFDASEMDVMIAKSLDFMDKSNLFLFSIILCAIGLAITALMSNLAMVNIFIPVVALLAIGVGKSPEAFAIPVTIAASCDFMFPMSTPPNAIAYSSGHIKASQMFKAGLLLNILSFLLLSGMLWLMLS